MCIRDRAKVALSFAERFLIPNDKNEKAQEYLEETFQSYRKLFALKNDSSDFFYNVNDVKEYWRILEVGIDIFQSSSGDEKANELQSERDKFQATFHSVLFD